jgi:hypothetical protein
MPAINNLCFEAIDLAKQHFANKFDVDDCTVARNDGRWKLGAVFADSVCESVVMHNTSAIQILGRFHGDTVVVLKKEETNPGSRIKWGERANKVVRKPWKLALGQKVGCTSRSLISLREILELYPPAIR